jgi:uncharacterized protein YyaL (SSP411 family)
MFACSALDPQGMTMATNRLGQATSPYLLQHADNPVHWRLWGDDALAEAKTRNVPILLSVGYAACHWCHVMAHESFENDAIAALMNEHFVNVKVDREERPDLDQIYQAALAMLGEQGGWPLTMFLTPQGEPFWGGTYFPPEPRYGRPSFPQVLLGIADAWANKQEQVTTNVSALMKALHQRAHSEAGGRIPTELIDRIAERFAQEVDRVHGGIGGAPKFPNPPIFELLWRGYRRRGDADLKTAVTVTLDRMCQGGIYDHLGGGFARYSTDARWLAPHFEKMLYDNAQLIDLLTQAWADTKSTLYARRVAETIAWLEREMIAEAGAFAATLDADSEGEEGRFYVWSAVEIDAVLGAEAAAFKRVYDVTPAGNWEGHVILNRLPTMLLGSAEQEDALAASRARLLERRATRIRPGRDDKILADWNGLMIAALARAGFAFDRADWIALGARAFAAVETLLGGFGDTLRHSYRAGRLGPLAMLDDFACLAKAAVALYEVTGEAHYRDAAETLVARAHERFWDAAEGGHFFTAAAASDVITRSKHAQDNATPSGNGVLAAAHARLFHLTGDETHRTRAAATIAAFSGALQRNFFSLPTLINAQEQLETAQLLVIVGPRLRADTRALLAAAGAAASLPNLVVQLVEDSSALAPAHPAHGKTMRGEHATAYLCRDQTCSAPIDDAALLAKTLARQSWSEQGP